MSPIGLAMTSAPESPRPLGSGLSTLAVVSLVVVALRVVGYTDDLTLAGFLGLILEGYFILLPVLAAIAVGLLQLQDRTRVATVIGVTTLTMVLLDFAPGHPGQVVSGRLGLDSSGVAVEMAEAPRWAAPGALERVVRCEAEGGCLGRFRNDAGRIRPRGLPFGVAYFKLFFLLAPAIVVTTSAAVRRWAEGALLFLDDSAEWLVSTLTIWVLPLGMLFLVNFFAGQAFLRVLARGWSPVTLAYPYLGLLVLAGLAWQYLPEEG